MRRINKLFYLSFIFLVVGCDKTQLTNNTENIIQSKHKELTISQLPQNFDPYDASHQWTDEEAVSVFNKAFHMSYGVEDITLFEEIVRRAKLGEQTPLYFYAQMLSTGHLDEDVIYHSKDHGNQAFIIYFNLAQQGALTSAANVIQYYTDPPTRELYKQHFNLDNQGLRTKMLEFAKLTLTDYRFITEAIVADIMLFDDQSSWEILLSEYDAIIAKNTYLKEAINLYQQCAYITYRYDFPDLTNSDQKYCMARMAEAYYYGYGVSQNSAYAYAWAKLLDESVKGTMRKNIKFIKELLPTIKQSLNEQALVDAERYYQQIVQQIEEKKPKLK